jgi:hypothetical protein
LKSWKESVSPFFGLSKPQSYYVSRTQRHEAIHEYRSKISKNRKNRQRSKLFAYLLQLLHLGAFAVLAAFAAHLLHLLHLLPGFTLLLNWQ